MVRTSTPPTLVSNHAVQAGQPALTKAAFQRVRDTHHPEPCPVDPTETAEVLVMKRMDPPEAAAYEEHLAGCPACAKIVEETRAFVQGMRDGSRQIARDDEKQK